MSTGRVAAAVAVVVALALVTLPSGGFGMLDEVRDARVDVAEKDDALFSVDAAPSVPVTCPGALVLLTNNLGEPATVTVALTNAGGGVLRASRHGSDRGTAVTATLAPGAGTTVYVAGVDGASGGSVAFEVTARTPSGTVFSTAETVPVAASANATAANGTTTDGC